MKKQSLSQSSAIAAEIKALEKRAMRAEINGNSNTVWHERLEQLRAAVKEPTPKAEPTPAPKTADDKSGVDNSSSKENNDNGKSNK